MAGYNPEFVGKPDAAEKAAIEAKVVGKLTEVLGVEVEQVMAEYVVVMVYNQKSMDQIRIDLEDFMGADGAETFVAWLYTLLSGEQNTAPPQATAPTETPKPVPVEASPEAPKRVVSLVSRSAPVEAKGTVRIIGKKSDQELEEAMRRRSERFGIPQKERSSQNEPANTSSKPSITDRLGKPSDARQHDNRRGDNRRDGNRDSNRDGARDNRRDGNNTRDREPQNRKRQMDDSDNDGEPRSKKAQYDDHRHGHGPPRGFPPGYMRGPPMYGGFPYGMPPPDFMYYPPPHMGGPGFGMHPPYGMRGPYGGPRPHGGAPRPFTNRKWVNPATVPPAAEDAAAPAEPASESDAAPPAEGATPTPTPAPQPTPAFGGPAPGYGPPRGNFFGFPRPRFQNKTWVRPEAQESANTNTEALSASLPKTP
ncbi:hypothetical protein ACHHYP_09267 [Achlya hypogyna]|uniref:PWI domain-containing protein n=1 Tax=Achlya hypogyna TaxID=1202772 RepID=A0A1V9ZJ76_ACHHY|nr:hypothetical protein ACHHYP_09267 [Achlya hypogyna]